MRSDADTPLGRALDKLERSSPNGEPDLTGAQAAAVLAHVGELEKALAHRGVEMAYESPVEVVPWEQIPEATRERVRAKCREIEADLERRGYRHVDNAADKGFAAPPFERWLWDLLNAIWPDNAPESLDADVMGDALYALSVLHETSAMYKGLCK